jgi:hypothetical protein
MGGSMPRPGFFRNFLEKIEFLKNKFFSDFLEKISFIPVVVSQGF